MQWLVTNADRAPGRRPSHALGVTAFVTVAAIAAMLATERAVSARRGALPMARQNPTDAVHNAVIVCNGAAVPAAPPVLADPAPTVPLRRTELFPADEVDGGRPVHDLDFADRDARDWR